MAGIHYLADFSSENCDAANEDRKLMQAGILPSRSARPTILNGSSCPRCQARNWYVRMRKAQAVPAGMDGLKLALIALRACMVGGYLKLSPYPARGRFCRGTDAGGDYKLCWLARTVVNDWNQARLDAIGLVE